MAVVAAEARAIEDGLGQKQAVGDDDGNVGIQRCEGFAVGGVAEIQGWRISMPSSSAA